MHTFIKIFIGLFLLGFTWIAITTPLSNETVPQFFLDLIPSAYEDQIMIDVFYKHAILFVYLFILSIIIYIIFYYGKR
jgi:hypothetical protein